jgi:hypothetical protein
MAVGVRSSSIMRSSLRSISSRRRRIRSTTNLTVAPGLSVGFATTQQTGPMASAYQAHPRMCSGDFLSPSPPAEKATARQDQARESRTREAVRRYGRSPPARQDFAFNLSAKRCLCNTVGGRIGRIVEGCAAYRCAVTAARSRALTMTNFARSSLALVLRAFFGEAKSCALVNIFMICPRWSAGG